MSRRDARSHEVRGMTLAELHAIDVPATWASLTPEQQAAIGEAAIAWQLASLAAESTICPAEINAAYKLVDDAELGVADAVEAALPEIDWDPPLPVTPPSNQHGAP